MKLKIPLIALALGALLATAYFGLRYWQADQARQLIFEQLPPQPDLNDWPSSLQSEVDQALEQIATSSAPQEGLASLAELYHANGYLQEAIACYRILLDAMPGEPKWPHLLANIYAGYGMLDEAIPLWEMSSQLDPSYPASHILRGNAQLKLNRLPEAEEAFRAALQADTEAAHALLGLGRIDIAREEWQAARQKLERAVTVSNGRVGLDLLATVYQKLDLLERARAIYRDNPIGTHSDIPDPWQLALYDHCYDPFQLGITGGQAAFAGNAAVGKRLLQRAVNLDPQDHMLRYQLGTLCLQLKDFSAAESHLRRAIELKSDFSDAWIQLAELQKTLGKPDAAAALLRQGFQNAPDSPALLMEMAKQYREAGQHSRAIALLKRSIELRPNEAQAYIELSLTLYGMQRNEEGLAAMQQALKAEPGHPLALSALAFDAISRGQAEEAKSYLERARLQPRIKPDELTRLAQRYESTFGRNPLSNP